MNETAWAEVAEAKANPLPTAPVGKAVQWFREGDKRNIHAAQVTGIEDSGRVKLVIHSHGQMPSYVTGCYHANSPIHAIENNPTTKRNGSWDYLPGETVPREDYEYHLQEIAKREANLKRAEEQAIAAAEKFQAQKAAAEEARRKALVTPPGENEPLIAPKRAKQTASA